MNISKYRRPRTIQKEDCPINLTIIEVREEPSKFSETGIRLYLESNLREKFSFWLKSDNLNTVANLYTDETDNWIEKELEFVHEPAREYEGRGASSSTKPKKRYRLKGN
jgi:hypothetical protein